MDRTVAIITPAFRAEDTIVAAVNSVLAQTYADWELWLVADDGEDYEALLAGAGIRDPRFRFLGSGGSGRGVAHTRNVALERITAPYAAVLDADDRMKPDKLTRALAALETHSIVTTALDVMTDRFVHLRDVGTGPDRILTPGAHKFVNFSGDSMQVWERRRTDGRYDPTLKNMSDLDFLLQLYRSVPRSFHLGTPLHDYVKRTSSMSNGADVAAGMIASKRAILRRLETGHYGLPDREAEGVAAFLAISLEAESHYGAALAARPGLLFEDHLEPRLAAARS